MPIGRIGVAFYTACLVAIGAISQESPQTIIKGGGAPASLSEQLRQHHVDLTREGLLKALRSPNQQVRYLAALRLAEEKDVDSVPAIEQTLAAEKVPETRINVAIALVQLGQEKGLSELTADCGDSELPGYFRARAMMYMLPLGSRTCLRAALDLLGSDPGSREQTLSLLALYPNPSTHESEDILDAITKCLTDESGAVRFQASEVLRKLANPSAIPFLQKAIATERDNVVRSQMESALQDLQARKQE